MEQPRSSETMTKTCALLTTCFWRVLLVDCETRISDLLAALRAATTMGEAAAATAAALKIRDVARQLTERVPEDQSENSAQLFSCIKELVLLMKRMLFLDAHANCAHHSKVDLMM